MTQRSTCSIDGCGKQILARGWCSKHYTRWARYGDPEAALPPRRRKARAKCGIDKCTEEVSGKSIWCRKHYERWKRHGDPEVVLPRRIYAPIEARFWQKVDKNGPIPEYAPHLGPCWLWLAAKGTKGYGVWGDAGPHRYSYVLANGPIPDGLQIDHLCRVRACVRPSHLEAVTWLTNQLRSPFTIAGKNSAKTHCDRGHPFDDANTKQRPGGGRSCRACIRENQIRQRAARKAAS